MTKNNLGTIRLDDRRASPNALVSLRCIRRLAVKHWQMLRGAARVHVEAALELAQATFNDKSGWLPVPKRIEILRRAATVMEGMEDTLAMAACE